MNLFAAAAESDNSVSLEFVLIVLAIIALIVFIFSRFRR
jgi:subtilase family serine protease